MDISLKIPYANGYSFKYQNPAEISQTYIWRRFKIFQQRNGNYEPVHGNSHHMTRSNQD